MKLNIIVQKNYVKPEYDQNLFFEKNFKNILWNIFEKNPTDTENENLDKYSCVKNNTSCH